MKVCTCFLLFGMFAYTNSISRIIHKGDHSVVNLSQETVSEYSNEESSGDTDHKIITKGTTVQDKNMQHVFRAPKGETLTGFIQKVVKILNTYEDIAFEDFFHVLDNEIRKYHYRGCKFSELTENSDTRSLLAESLKLIRRKSVSFTKANINEVANMMRDETYDKNVKELLDYINSLYINTELNFHNVLYELKQYRNTKSLRNHNNLVQVIRGGVRAVLFNPYSELNSNKRRELKERIETFWKQFKNNPASSVEMNDIPYTDPAIKSVINRFDVSENIMNEVKNPKSYSENDPQVKPKNKRERNVSSSIQTLSEQSQGHENEKDESSNESRKQITNYDTDEISSGQPFDSRSNAIKHSQERHEEYNTQRYMTLYTEEISYKTKTTKKKEIMPIFANVMKRRPKVMKRSTTTSTPRETDEFSDRSKKLEMLRTNQDTYATEVNISNSKHNTESGPTLESKPKVRASYDKQRKQGKANKSRFKSKQKKVEFIGNAVIDVQLANTELLRSLGMFEPLGMDTDSRYDTTLSPKSDRQTEPVLTISTIRPRSMRPHAEIKPQKPTASTKPPSRYSKRNKPLYRKQFSNFRKNIALPLPNEHPVDQFMKDKNPNQKYLRRSGNNTMGAEDFNAYIIKRIDAMENKLNELKQMNDFRFSHRMDDNNTNGVEALNVTDKFEGKDKVDSKRKDMKGNVIERLLNEDHDLNNKEVDDKHVFPTINNTINTESSTNYSKQSQQQSRKLNVIQKDAVNATVIDNKNTTQVINNISKINVNVTKKLDKGVINNNVTTSIILVKVTNTMTIQSVVTPPTVGITRGIMAYSEPSYYNSDEDHRARVPDSEMDPFFKNLNNGLDFHM